MSITTELLRLRRDQASSVAALLSSVDWQRSTGDAAHRLARSHDVMRIADLVLLNVAAHAADALAQLPTLPKTRRAAASLRSKRRRPNPSQLHQRRLFA